MEKGSRRDFLKSGLALMAAAAMPSCSSSKENEAVSESNKQVKTYKIVERTLGRTGIELPIISMGDGGMEKAIYRAALDAGIRHFDTDATYRDGIHEKLIGEIIKEYPRESMIVCTKVGIPSLSKPGADPDGIRGEELLKPLEGSWKRLGVEYLDILYLHSISSAAAASYSPVLETLQKLKEKGRTRSLGISVHGYEPDVMRAAVDCGVYDVIMVSYNFKQRHADAIKKAIAHAAAAGLGIVAMKTQAGAFLDRERTKPVNHRAAIKWVLSDTNVHTAIPAIKNVEELDMYMSVMSDLRLTPDEEEDLASARIENGLYCQQCQRCVPQCPHAAPIPLYMRAFMYAYGYGDPGKAKKTISETVSAGPPCRRCSTCGVACAMGFDVRARIMDVARVLNIPDDFLIS